MRLRLVLAVAGAAALAGAPAQAALTGDPGPAPAEAKSCKGGLEFGMATSRIPFACGAYPVQTRMTPTGRQEKWQYKGGYLFFIDGILTAIRQIAP